MDTVTIPRIELLQVADAVAREKGIEREQVLEAMEMAIQKAARSKYGHEHDIRATIDRGNGSVKLARYRQVADPIENEATQIKHDDAKKLDATIETVSARPAVGDNIVATLKGTGKGQILLIAHMDTVFPRGTDLNLRWNPNGYQVGESQLNLEGGDKAGSLDWKLNWNISLKAGRSDAAVAWMRQAVQADPGNAVYRNDLGVFHVQAGQMAEAAQCFQDAIALRRDNPEAYNNLCYAFCTLGRFEEALASGQKALELRPGAGPQQVDGDVAAAVTRRGDAPEDQDAE